MFTVKWIADNGSETLYAAAKDVHFTPADAQNASGSGAVAKASVSFYLTDGDVHCSIDCGRVYVMNANGRTVADYVLSTKEFPHGLAPRQAA